MTCHFIDNDVSLGIFDDMTDYLQSVRFTYHRNFQFYWYQKNFHKYRKSNQFKHKKCNHSSLSGTCVLSLTWDSLSWTRDILWKKPLLGTCSHNASVISYKHANNDLHKVVSSGKKKWIVIFTCLLNKDFKMSSTSAHKEEFYSKLKTTKNSNNHLISHEH